MLFEKFSAITSLEKVFFPYDLFLFFFFLPFSNSSEVRFALLMESQIPVIFLLCLHSFPSFPAPLEYFQIALRSLRFPLIYLAINIFYHVLNLA